MLLLAFLQSNRLVLSMLTSCFSNLRRKKRFWKMALYLMNLNSVKVSNISNMPLKFFTKILLSFFSLNLMISMISNLSVIINLSTISLFKQLSTLKFTNFQIFKYGQLSRHVPLLGTVTSS